MKERDVIDGLDALRCDEFDLSDESSRGLKKLDRLADAICDLGFPSSILPMVFSTLERLYREGPYLDHAWSLIHTTEKFSNYEDQLQLSIERFPTPTSVLMVNRILNMDNPKSYPKFCNLLEQVLIRPESTHGVKVSAREYIEFQMNGAR